MHLALGATHPSSVIHHHPSSIRVSDLCITKYMVLTRTCQPQVNLGLEGGGDANPFKVKGGSKGKGKKDRGGRK